MTLSCFFIWGISLLVFLRGATPTDGAAQLPAKDMRATRVQTVDTPRSFPQINSKTEWKARARDIREQVLVSCGLWPLPEKTPLNAKIFGRIEREGYSVENVYFQTYPGFYLAGNLYRPRGRGNGPFPAILNPCGHWPNGRLADTNNGSVPARCINFAKQGMIAFSYDMVGFNDMTQLGPHRRFFRAPKLQLWDISVMGLQTWNSIRALDFLESLPEADKTRLACTGESGGGTQTFMLGGADGRISAQAPVVMVSHTFQGDCICENAPGLRVNYSNVEIAAVPAPHPQILVGATGDWTKQTLTVEGLAIESVYRLFNAQDKLRYVCFDFDHNYNQTSREAVYTWFNKWLLNPKDSSPVKELAYKKEPDQALRVWPDNKLPADALNESQLSESLIKAHQAQWQALKPTDKKSLAHFKTVMLPLWRHTMQVEFPEAQNLLVETGKMTPFDGLTATQFAFGRKGKEDRILAVLFIPEKEPKSNVVILAHAAGKSTYLSASGTPTGLAKELIGRGFSVMLTDLFLTGEMADPELAKTRQYSEKFYLTYYNRTDVQERVQDLMTACAFARKHAKARRVILCGAGRSGFPVLLAAPAADAVIADCDALNISSDEALMSQDLFLPGIRNLGAFEGAAILAAPNPLLLHNTGGEFLTASLSAAYAAVRAVDSFREESARLSDAELATRISQLRLR
jgi:dienelactone hydrolase